MSTAVTMPVLGLTMEEGTVAEWLKQVGDTVARDEPLLTVEMDKGTVEVPSPVAGVLSRILVDVGATVAVKTPIAEISDSAEAVATSSEPPVAGSAGGPGDLPSRPPAAEAAVATSAAMVTAGEPTRAPEASTAERLQRVFASPRARLRAREMDIDLQALTGSGPQGRIVEADVLSATQVPAADGARVVATPIARRLAQEHGVALEALRGTGPGGRVTQDDVLRAAGAKAPGAPPAEPSVRPLSRVRRITAERMAASAQATARVTLFLDADLTEAARFRAQLLPEFERLGVPKLPWDALIAKAAGLALAEHAALLAQWSEDGAGLRQPDEVNVGVAVTLEPEGLVVPVLRRADHRSLRELSAELLGLVDKARAGRLAPEDMQGGAFTITNLGGYRIDGFTPIINPPETAILGVGRIAERPVVVAGSIEIRTLCTLSLSFDHRVIDGAPAAAFLARLAELLERPYALLGV
jgi:pyruvate dehydrogenase E2 component (dihydrolipoamide acetyltransferase)